MGDKNSENVQKRENIEALYERLKITNFSSFSIKVCSSIVNFSLINTSISDFVKFELIENPNLRAQIWLSLNLRAKIHRVFEFSVAPSSTTICLDPQNRISCRIDF